MAKGGKGGGGSNSGNTAVRGTNGNDKWKITDLAAFATTSYDGRGGSDTLDFSGIEQGFTLRVSHTIRGSKLSVEQAFIGVPGSLANMDDLPGLITDTIKSVENLVGGSGNDWLTIYDPYTSNYIYGGGGNDYLDSANFGTETADDVLIGGDGEDWIATDGIAVGGEWDIIDGEIWNPDFSHLPGRLVDGVFVSDGKTDTFFGNDGTILDFELGIDRLVLRCTSDAVPGILSTEWIDHPWIDTNGNAHAAADLNIIWPNGESRITLVGITAAQAATITLNFSLGGLPPEPNVGGPGDDYLGTTGLPDIFIFPIGGGNDTITLQYPYSQQQIFNFNFAEDKLSFPGSSDPGEGDWKLLSAIGQKVNGQDGIIYQYSPDDSVTILGLTLADASLIQFA